MNEAVPHKLTPLAIVVAFILTIPGLFIGQIGSLLYGWFLSPMFDGNLFDWISGGWFKTITMAIIPNALAGAIAGYFAVRVTFAIKPLKQANYEIIAYAVSAIVVVFTVLAVLFILQRDGMNVRVIETLSNTVGLIGSLFAAQQSVQSDQRALVPRNTVA